MKTHRDGYEHLGDLSAAPPWHSVHMVCESCKVSWTGCWDNFQCPKCGEGELPSADIVTINEPGPLLGRRFMRGKDGEIYEMPPT